MKRLGIDYLMSADHVIDLMRSRGRKPQLTAVVLSAALELAEPASPRAQLIEETTAFFRRKAARVPVGLEDLPSCWLLGIPGILLATCQPHWNWIPYMVADLRITKGILRLRFAQEEPTDHKRVTSWDELRITLNLCLRPNLWCPLNRRLEHQIWVRRPDLRNELFQVSI